MKLGLENMTLLCHELGNPQQKFPSVHIAGTNGKGSTTAMVGSMLRAAGYNVGVYTSPHLVDFRERITINGARIDKRFVVSFIEVNRSYISRRKITFFELMTAMAFAYFAKRKTDIAVIEVGLGGRLDATNIIAPLVSAITGISRDHMNVLGATLEAIAAEKAGIIKPGVPLILAKQPQAVRRVIKKIAKQRHAPVMKLAPAQEVSRYSHKLPLSGRHQRENLAVALSIVEALQSRGYSVSKPAINKGIQFVNWPGRFQRLQTSSGATIVLDVAHNEGGLAALYNTFRSEYPNRKAWIVMGFVRDKRLGLPLTQFHKIALSIHITRLPTKRSADPSDIAAEFGSREKIRTCATCKTAFRAAFSSAKSGDLILIMGSHYLVGEFLSSQSQYISG